MSRYFRTTLLWPRSRIFLLLSQFSTRLPWQRLPQQPILVPFCFLHLGVSMYKI